MKKIIISVAALLTMSIAAQAQSENDVFLTSQTLTTGTARSISLGGAMGAIGGDFSALSINPAGIGVYRSSEFSFTLGLNYNDTKTTYNGVKSNDQAYNMPINQIGYVGTWSPMREVTNGIVSTHFGIGYNRINGFDQNFILRGNNVMSSLLDNFVDKSNGLNPNPKSDYDYKYGQLDVNTTGLAYGAYLTDLVLDTTVQYYHVFDSIDVHYYDENGELHGWNANQGIAQRQMIEKNGYGGEYSFNFGMNISNLLMLGASLNFQNMQYDEANFYREINAYGLQYENEKDIDYYDYIKDLDLSGTSVNGKFGVIVKPINAVRIGLAYHTPNYYSINQEYSTRIRSFFKNGDKFDEGSGNSHYEYKFQTPGKIVASLGLVGSMGFLSVDYEYMDYTKSKFRSQSDNFDGLDEFEGLNNDIETYFQAVHNIRVGAEYKVNDFLMARAGVGIYGSPYKKIENVQNDIKRNTYSVGLGYRNSNFFADFAYLMVNQKQDYYPYGYANAAKVDITNHQVTATFGWKF